MAALLLTPGSAHAQSPDACQDLTHVQTYSPDHGFFRAPAWHFERTVTIVYSGQMCEMTDAAGNLVREIKGHATIVGGPSHDGATIESAPFESELRTNLPGDATGMWWSCGEGTLEYRWSIKGIYDFKVVAQDGTWTVEQSDPAGNRPLLRRSANACGAS